VFSVACPCLGLHRPGFAQMPANSWLSSLPSGRETMFLQALQFEFSPRVVGALFALIRLHHETGQEPLIGGPFCGNFSFSLAVSELRL
jgi:hypothetical protein